MQSTTLAGRAILIVEDEPLVALDISLAFEAMGALILTARSLADAVRLVECDGLSAAVVDLGLADGDTEVLCARLKERSVPFILPSGYSHLGDACDSGVVVPKPAHPATLVETVIRLLH